MDTLREFAELWNLGLLVAVFGILGWFVYSVFLRKFIRARRIANLRFKRMARERNERLNH